MRRYVQFLAFSLLFVFVLNTCLASNALPQRILDDNQQLLLKKVGHMTDQAKNVRVIDEYAYVLADVYPDGVILKIFDVSNPKHPVEIGTCEEEMICHSFEVEGSIAYVADNNVGLKLINISDRASPELVGDYSDNEGDAGGIFVKYQVAYLADGNDGLEIINTSNPINPVKIGQYYNGSGINNIHVADNIAYLCELDGLEIVDISNVSSPSLISKYSDLGGVNDVVVVEDCAFVTTFSQGLVILNISNPYLPRELSQLYDGGESVGIQIVNNELAFIADLADGLEVVNITDKSNPVELGQVDTGGSALFLHVKGNYVYVADQLNGVEIIQIWKEAEAVPGFGFSTVILAAISISFLVFQTKKDRKKP